MTEGLRQDDEMYLSKMLGLIPELVDHNLLKCFEGFDFITEDRH